MDPWKFDGMIRKLSGALSRRSLVGGSLGASVLAAVGIRDDAAHARKKHRAGAEACIPTGKKCPSKKARGKKGKKLGCDKCCQGITVTITSAKGKKVTKCSCKPLDSVCTPDKSQQCCSGVCGDGKCQFAPCLNAGSPCTSDEQCCGPQCADGTCHAVICQALGVGCDVAADCCSGFCFDSTCQPGVCEEVGEACVVPGECCSDGCVNGVCCVPEGGFCVGLACCAGLVCPAQPPFFCEQI